MWSYTIYLKILIGVAIVLFSITVVKIIRYRINIMDKDPGKKYNTKTLFQELIKSNKSKESELLFKTRRRVLYRLIQLFVIVITGGVLIYMIPPLRTISLSLLAGAGIVAVIIGFALQKIMANLFAGVFIALYEPFRIGDFIMVDERRGIVEDITLHHTILHEWRNRRYIVPNALILDGFIENYTISNTRIYKTFEVGISYDSDIDLAREIILDEANKHPNLLIPEEHVENALIRHTPAVRVISWENSGMKLRVGFWVKHPIDGYQMKFDLLESIKKRFDKEGVEIPYPYRTLVYKKDLKKTGKLKKSSRRKL